jgi:hypothetical protein
MISLRRPPIRFLSLLPLLASILAACSGEPSATQAASSIDESLSANAAPAAAHAAPKEWHRAMARMKKPKEGGCFQATYPSTTWEEVPCGAAPDVAYQSKSGGATPYTVGGGSGDFSPTVSGTISWAEGSFPYVATTGENDNGAPDIYSLQLNSNIFSHSSFCNGAVNPSACTAWEQFIYAPSVNAAGQSGAFIQYWVYNYGNACPAPWKQSGHDCTRNSNVVPVPAQPVSNLANMVLTGTAGSSDSVALSVNGTIYAVSLPNQIDLNTHWETAEFNVYGNGSLTMATFDPNTTIIVQTLADSVVPTTDQPACVETNFTGETNNLNLPKSCCPVGGTTPGIQFIESNAATPPALPACPLQPLDPNWSLVAHPFDGLASGIDNDGVSHLVPCRGTYKNSVQVGKTRSDWAYCDIGYAGTETHLSVYETLVPAWTEETNGAVPANALRLGSDGSSSGPGLYACRAYVNGTGYQLGKVRPGLGGCFIPYGGHEITATHYEVLTSTLPLTIGTVNGTLPPFAVVGGYDSDDAPLYPCLAVYQGGFVPGKTKSNWSACDVGYGNQEHFLANYAVLLPNFTSSGSTPFNAGTDADGTALGVCNANYGNGLQVGKLLARGACNFGFASKEVSLTSGYAALSF